LEIDACAGSIEQRWERLGIDPASQQSCARGFASLRADRHWHGVKPKSWTGTFAARSHEPTTLCGLASITSSAESGSSSQSTDLNSSHVDTGCRWLKALRPGHLIDPMTKFSPTKICGLRTRQ